VAASHVLALLGVGPTGIFTQDAWTIEAGPGLDGVLGAMASGHEAHHAALNASSAWGAVLQALAIAGRKSTGSPQLGQTLVALVNACRRTHEAYATHASVMDTLRADAAATRHDLLAGYPDYQHHFDTAVALGPPIDILNAWRQVAAESALQACMQSTALLTLTEHGLGQFTAASIRRRDQPDRRLAVLMKASPRWWSDIVNVGRSALGDRWDILSSLSVRDAVARRPEMASTWAELRRLSIDAALHALRREELESLSVQQVRELLPEIVSQLTRAIDGDDAGLVLDTATDAGTFGLFEMETVRLGSPRPANVARLAGMKVPALLSATGNDRHLYIVVRHPGQLLRRYEIRSGHEILAGREPVIAVQTWEGDDSPVTLHVITDERELRTLSAAAAPYRLVSSISLKCNQNEKWRNRWAQPLQQLTTATLLLDLPITQCIDAFLSSGEPFRYTLVTTPVREKHAITFVCRVGGDPPILLPCTMTAGQAFVQYAHRKSGKQLKPDMSALAERSDEARLVVAHVLDSERILGNLTG
jgi:hypothetical protein